MGIGRNLKRVADMLHGGQSQVQFIEVDLGADSNILIDAISLMHRILNTNSSGPLVFVSNASIIEPIAQSTELDLPDLERSMRINCITPLMIANSLAKIAKAQNRSLLVLNISSGAASRPVSGWQAYCTSKAAYKMGLDVMVAENSHVRVVHFDPGVMDTPMQELIRTQQVEDMPEVEVFRSYQQRGVLKAPLLIANELVQLIEHHFS